MSTLADTFEISTTFSMALPPADEWRDVVLLDDLRERGCIDSLKVWDEKNVLIDGHRRLDLIASAPEITDKHGEPPVVRLSFECEQAALAWVIGYQNGRRNTSKVAQAVTDGLTVRDERGGDRRSDEFQSDNDVTLNETERQQRTRDKKTAEGWQIVSDVSPEAAQSILSDAETTVTKKDLQDVAKATGNGQTARATAIADKAISKAHVAHNSGEHEWYTPAEYIEAARATMGTIDLDPASCELAQETVKAGKFYTKDDDGLGQSWACGNLWMNPPYSSYLINEFVIRLCHEVGECRVNRAIVLVNNATDTAWFQKMARHDHASATCFPKGRIKFIDQDGNPAGAPLQGQAILYFGDEPQAFIDNFEVFGFCVLHAKQTVKSILNEMGSEGTS